jgi:hypothetical protein
MFDLTTPAIFLTSIALLAVGSPARAEETATDDAATDVEITVTASIDRYAPRTSAATRTGTPMLAVPFSIDAVGGGAAV